MFFRRFAAIFVSPYQVFDDIRASRVRWWQPWLMVSVVVMIVGWLMIPVQMAMIEADPEMAAQVEGAEGMMKITQIIGVLTTPLLVLIAAVLMSGITYVVVTLMSKEATFNKYLTLILFADVVASVGFLATVLILRARGLDQISSPEDLKAGLSLRLFAPGAGPVLGGILGSIEFFAIWGFTLIVLGLRRVFGFGLGAAIACCIPLWLLYTGFTIVAEVIQNRQ